MSNLKTALLIVKNTSEQEFQKVYTMIKTKYIKEHINLSSYSIDSLVEELEKLEISMSFQQVSGISVFHQGIEKKLFAFAEYGWDGGSPIMTQQFNLKILEKNDFGGGPTASIVTLQNKDYPGFAMYYAPAEYSGEIHIFM